ncbi:endonuclease/exonuclease/phosphatase family protein [Cellulomonas dongxiuzhuiae]|uniref:Endonuclease/exonuclease/phosphatase family protein n=1 Tax=Cellulomonas dongxiuzhuiae TaxID=2819979 RepID=A0ABX8GHA6_9CELL|nr:endonuclease/exonuclease/phosphatase family protein [Cellulomonas dongxiuzhuiae]MBO3094245.1 endonuclease/exonuclease/phosphatase family protein [Cellulomonas dongxiuzhuiae]QWC15295.1 endonuclease/exonuclease/phosphatase family protein [Cellulomonas dongxiuzhuiae]
MPLDRFTVATVNLFNLQLPGRPMNPGQAPWTESEYARKTAWLAERLRDLRADVVGLQELWHRDALVAALERADLDDDYDVVADTATGGRITCAALVRRGLLHGTPQWVADFPSAVRLHASDTHDPQAPEIDVRVRRFSRPVLRFAVAPRADRPPVEVAVVHLKSKVPTRVDREAWYRDDPDTFSPHVEALGAAISTIRRTAEAAALRVVLTDLMKGSDTPVVVLGDVNDGQHSNTVNILTGQPRYLVGDARGGTDAGLYTAQTLQEYRDTRDVYYTHVHEDLRESLDHVLVSEQLYDNSRRRVWLFDGLTIVNDHLSAPDHRADGSGDHGLVRVAFRWAPAAA